jgi:hypothetical protein
MQDLEQSVRERAYHLWLESGRPDGNADEHWLAAQREVLSASLGTFGSVSVAEHSEAPKKSTKPRKVKAKKVQDALPVPIKRVARL